MQPRQSPCRPAVPSRATRPPERDDSRSRRAGSRLFRKTHRGRQRRFLRTWLSGRWPRSCGSRSARETNWRNGNRGCFMIRLLPEEVIDAENRVLREHCLCDAIELPRGRQIASERFFDDHSRMLRQVRRAESFDHRLEQRRWDGEVVRRATSATKRLLYRRERLRLLIIPTDVLELRQKWWKACLLSIPPDRLMLSVTRFRRRARLHFGKATPIIGTLRCHASPSHRVPGKSSCGRDRPSRRKAPARPNERRPSGASLAGNGRGPSRHAARASNASTRNIG